MKLPTIQEQQSLHHVDALLNSNLLALQVNELLNQVKGEKTFKKKKFVEWIDCLVNDLSNISLSSEDSKLSHAWLESRKFSGLTVVNDDDTINFDFAKPAAVEFVGSYAINANILPTMNIDIAVLLPDEMFNQKYFFILFFIIFF
jgi:hypothetical protein